MPNAEMMNALLREKLICIPRAYSCLLSPSAGRARAVGENVMLQIHADAAKSAGKVGMGSSAQQRIGLRI
jgi:N-acetylmuramoyl-L-alanine amidase